MENGKPRVRLNKIVTGGQTGVDRAALNAAMAKGVEVGGWCPMGRRAEDGPIDTIYPLEETPATEYAQRTIWNVRDSEGTLIITMGSPTGGTALTIEAALQQGKPHLIVDAASEPAVEQVWDWLTTHRISILNIAGPRESEMPGIYWKARTFMEALLK